MDVVDFPSREEYIELLQSGNIVGDDQERYVRTQLWWAFNDLIRHEDTDREKGNNTIREQLDIFTENLDQLKKLVQVEDPESQLFIAEINRQTGNFKEALSILERDWPKNLQLPAQRILKASRAKYRSVLQLSEDISAQVTDSPNMNMDKLEIPPTCKTPEVILNPDGNMLIKGRAIPEDACGFFDRLVDWIEGYGEDPMDKTSVSIMLEYVNDGSMQYIVYMLRQLAGLEDLGLELEIKWYYEYFDDDMKELGVQFAYCIKHPVDLISIDKISP